MAVDSVNMVVVIDQDVSFTAGTTYSLLVRLQTGELNRWTLAPITEDITTNTLSLLGNMDDYLVHQYDLVSVGVQSLETKPFRVVSITRNGDLQATINLVEYVEAVYVEDTDYPVINYTNTGAAINSLTVNADSNDGRLKISWSVPEDKDYAGAWVIIDGKPQGFRTTEQLDYVLDTTPGSHTIKVVPVDGCGS